ncbi:MAG: gliding motility protein GldN [Ginsengibacter sp.]
MNKLFVKCFLLAICFSMATSLVDAQAKKRTVKKRTTAKRTTNARSGANIKPTATIDTVPAVAKVDSLPIQQVKKSLRQDGAVERNIMKDKMPLAYEHIREDDAVYRERLWREIDIREKQNLPFRYAGNDDNGNQRFISILFKAIQDGPDNGGVTVFDAIDDRFTTPLSVKEVAAKISGGSVSVPIYDSLGNITGYKETVAEVNLDSFYKFRIKEEVVFDKESSRLFWRILGIAPVKNVITAQGLDVGETELFWVYYPDMRPIFSKYEVYNGKNFGARMSWEDLFESRMFYGRIIKSTLDNPYDKQLKEYQGLKDNQILQLLEGEDIKDKIFNYEQNLWSY